MVFWKIIKTDKPLARLTEKEKTQIVNIRHEIRAITTYPTDIKITIEEYTISFSSVWKWKVKVKSLSRVQLFATPWTVAHQAPLSIGFSRQEWSGLPLPSPVICSAPAKWWKLVTVLNLSKSWPCLFRVPPSSSAHAGPHSWAGLHIQEEHIYNDAQNYERKAWKTPSSPVLTAPTGM